MPPRTIREETVGNARLRLLRGEKDYLGIIIAGGKASAPIEGSDANELWQRLLQLAGQTDPRYFGHAGARKVFLDGCPGGFGGQDYRGNERNHKDAARDLLTRTLPLDAAADWQGGGKAAMAVFQATQLLSPFEKIRIKATLQGPRAAEFIRAAAAFTLGDVPGGLARMGAALGPDDAAKWTVVTYLPFFWRPETHLFLKPETTRDFAARVGHPFAHDYEPALTAKVHASLTDLGRETFDHIADLGPADMIDIQSYIFIVGNHHRYEAAREAARAGMANPDGDDA